MLKLIEGLLDSRSPTKIPFEFSSVLVSFLPRLSFHPSFAASCLCSLCGFLTQADGILVLACSCHHPASLIDDGTYHQSERTQCIGAGSENRRMVAFVRLLVLTLLTLLRNIAARKPHSNRKSRTSLQCEDRIHLHAHAAWLRRVLQHIYMRMLALISKRVRLVERADISKNLQDLQASRPPSPRRAPEAGLVVLNAVNLDLPCTALNF